MNEFLFGLGGILAMLGFFYLGKASGAKAERNKKPAPVKPVCPCGHVWGDHFEEGDCQAEHKRRNDPYVGHKWVKCACTKYHGPVIVTKEFFDPGTFIQ